MKNQLILILFSLFTAISCATFDEYKVPSICGYDKCELVYGYVNTKGEWLALPDPKFNNFDDFKNGVAYGSGVYWGKYLDKNGKIGNSDELLTPELLSLKKSVEVKGLHMVGFAETVNNNEFFVVRPNIKNKEYKFKSGIINRKGELVGQTDAEIISNFKLSLAKAVIEVNSSHKEGFVNIKGGFVVSPIYFIVDNFQENGLSVASSETGECLVDRTGKEITSYRYSRIYDFKEGLARVVVVRKEKNKNNTALWLSRVEQYGVINEKGEEIVPPIYDYISDLENGEAVVKTSKGLYGVINEKGEIIIPPKYTKLSSKKDGLYRVGKLWKTVKIKSENHTISLYGYIDENNKYVIYPIFLDAKPFNGHGEAFVRTIDGWGVINTKGKFIIEPQFYAIETSKDAWYLVKNKDGWGITDGKGNWRGESKQRISQILYTDFNYYFIFASVNEGSKFPSYGVFDMNGEWILKPKFAQIFKFYNGISKVAVWANIKETRSKNGDYEKILTWTLENGDKYKSIHLGKKNMITKKLYINNKLVRDKVWKKKSNGYWERVEKKQMNSSEMN